MVRYKGGDPLNISATAWNRMLDLVGYDVSATAEYTRGSVLYRWVWVKYQKLVSTPSDYLERGAPILIETPDRSDILQKLEFEAEPQNFIFRGRPCVIDDLKPYQMGITLDKHKSGEIGRVAVEGIVYANLKLPIGLNAFDVSSFNYAVPLQSSDPDHVAKLMQSTSGFAQVIGFDHFGTTDKLVALGRHQNVFKFQITEAAGNSNSILANIYGICPYGGSSHGGLVQEDVGLHYPFAITQGLPYAIGDTGFCIRTGASTVGISNYAWAIINPGISFNALAKTTTIGTGRSGNTAGTGYADLYRVLPNNQIVRILDTNNSPISIVYKNVSCETIGNNKFIQLKLIGSEYVVDFEDSDFCPY